jgi:hypothetical protein
MMMSQCERWVVEFNKREKDERSQQKKTRECINKGADER